MTPMSDNDLCIAILNRAAAKGYNAALSFDCYSKTWDVRMQRGLQ